MAQATTGGILPDGSRMELTSPNTNPAMIHPVVLPNTHQFDPITSLRRTKLCNTPRTVPYTLTPTTQPASMPATKATMHPVVPAKIIPTELASTHQPAREISLRRSNHCRIPVPIPPVATAMDPFTRISPVKPKGLARDHPKILANIHQRDNRQLTSFLSTLNSYSLPVMCFGEWYSVRFFSWYRIEASRKVKTRLCSRYLVITSLKLGWL